MPQQILEGGDPTSLFEVRRVDQVIHIHTNHRVLTINLPEAEMVIAGLAFLLSGKTDHVISRALADQLHETELRRTMLRTAAPPEGGARIPPPAPEDL